MKKIIDVINELSDLKIFVFVENGKLKTHSNNDALTPDVVELIKENKTELLAYLNRLSNSKSKEQKEIAPQFLSHYHLSFAQQRLWLLDKIDGGSSHYNMPAALMLAGALNLEALQFAFSRILERHESLRTCFSEDDDGQPIQIIRNATGFNVQLIDLAYLNGETQLAELALRIEQNENIIFDLSCDLMLRVQIMKLSDVEHVLLVNMHHIASDGWSMSILINEFSLLYTTFFQGQANSLTPLAIQYMDYAYWQRHWLQGEVLDEQLDYWITQLSELPAVHSLPLDKIRPTVQSFVGQTYQSQVSQTSRKRLKSLCLTHRATLFMGLHATFSVLLSRYSNETDIVIGSPIANREQAEVAPLIGFFINNLVLRSDLSDNPTFSELLKQSKNMLLDAYAHQQVPFEQIVEKLQPERSLSHSPLFQVMLVLQNNEQGTFDLPGITLSRIEQEGNIAKYDLTLTIVEREQGFSLRWEFNTDLFKLETITSMASHFDLLLSSLLENPEQSVFKADMLTDTEIQYQLVVCNDTAVEYPKEKCIHQLFEEQVANNPDAIAVVFEESQLTYAELNRKSNQLAHYLVEEKLVTPDSLVGICVERSLEMIIGILAILKAGGAYVPLDPNNPNARLEYMLNDARLAILLTKSHLRESIPISGIQAVYLDDVEFIQNLKKYSTQDLCVSKLGLRSSHLAYVIYTSGSTGQPKGVMVEHYNVVRLMDSTHANFKFNELDVWTMFHSYAFDFSVWEIWGALSQGGRLVVVPYWISRSPSDFYHLLVEQEITVLNQTPSAFSNMIQEDQLNNSGQLCLRYVIFGGEALNMASLIPWIEKYGDNSPRLINMYGITETTVHVTYRCLTSEAIQSANGASLIGTPLSDLTLLILNQQQVLVPVGVPGEIYVGGAGVTRGYLNHTSLTESYFITLPEYDNQRFYRTGDIARYLQNGELEYLGRVDNQVKIRGFRIELGEIESALTVHEKVNDSVVLAKDSVSGDKKLVAYVVTDLGEYLSESNAPANNEPTTRTADSQSFIEQLRLFLEQSLPDYMMPRAYVLLNALPLTTNGKVDYKSLPEPDLTIKQTCYVAPRTETERILCEVWQEVLGVECIGVTDSYFALGGDSILSIRVTALANQQDLNFTIRDIFVYQTISDLSGFIDNNPKQLDSSLNVNHFSLLTKDEKQMLRPLIDESVIEDSYPLSAAQQGMIFHYLVAQEQGTYHDVFSFNILEQWSEKAFTKALKKLIQNNELLRSLLFDKGDRLLHVIYRNVPTPLKVYDLRNTSQMDQEIHLDQWKESEKKADFKEDMPLWSIAIFRLSDECFQYNLSCHHALMDGWSVATLQTELFSQYLKALNDEELLDSSPLPYRYFIAEELASLSTVSAKNYWIRSLSKVEVPWWTGMQKQGCVHTNLVINDEQSELLRSLAKGLRVQEKSIFLTLHMVLLGYLSGKRGVASSVVFNGRPEMLGSEKTLGLFLNSLPFSLNYDDVTWKQLIQLVDRRLIEVSKYRQYPLANIQQDNNLDFSGALFNFVNFHIYDEITDDLNIVAGDTFEETNYLYELNCSKIGANYSLSLTLDAIIFNSEFLQRIEEYLQNILNELLERPNKKVNSELFMDQIERDKMSHKWNYMAEDYPKELCIHELFETQVERTPDAIAVVFEESQLTYGELNARANQLAQYLVECKQVKPDTLVGICVERSLMMVIGILAILKSGGAYVPLDPDYPKARLNYMLEDANLSTILTQSDLREHSPVEDSQAVCLDDIELLQQLSCYSKGNLSKVTLGLTSSHLAYVIYTSGSTGQPKGVCISHKSWQAYSSSILNVYQLNDVEKVLQFSSISFDIFVEELTLSLLNGGTLILPRVEQILSISEFWLLIEEYQVTVVTLPTAYWHQLCVNVDLIKDFEKKVLKLIIVGGEALSTSHLKNWQQRLGTQIRLLNTYGPTESTVISSYYDVTDFESSSMTIPIGKATSACYLIVLDKDQCLVPQGIAGELYIGGDCLSRGYLNRPELTDEKFVANPFYDATVSNNSKRLYKTGDLVRWLPDGNMEFLGRIDEQVKIRGFRVELGEIENQLSAYEGISSCLVLARKDNFGQKGLVAYVIMESNEERTEQDFIVQLKQQLLSILPAYMLPSTFVLIDEWPLTPNGKVNKRALPAPDGNSLQGACIPPVTKTEKALVDIWASILNLNVSNIGLKSNFFELGGHSLLVLNLANLIYKHWGIEFPLKALFNNSTVKELAWYIDGLVSQEKANINFNVIALESSLSYPQIIIVPALGMMSISYLYLAKQLSHKYDVLTLTTPGIDDPVDLDSKLLTYDLTQRIDYWYDAIKSTQPTGHFRLLGHSFGGAVAFELARRLEREGNSVELGLIDATLSAPMYQNSKVSLAEILLSRQDVKQLELQYGIEISCVSNELLYQALIDKNIIPKISKKQFDVYCMACEKQLNIFQFYQPFGKLDGQVTLFNAKEGLSSSVDRELIIDHIQSWCDKQLSVFNVEGTHLSVIQKQELLQNIEQAFTG